MAGADVALCARRAGRLRGAASEWGGRGGRVAAVAMDASDASSVRAAFDAAERALGGPCDVVVNCAGIAIPKRAVDVTEQEYDELMAVNQRGAFFVAQRRAWGRDGG
eukprot:gene1660-10862_t